MRNTSSSCFSGMNRSSSANTASRCRFRLLCSEASSRMGAYPRSPNSWEQFSTDGDCSSCSSRWEVSRSFSRLRMRAERNR